jgi:hypothetical protein
LPGEFFQAGHAQGEHECDDRGLSASCGDCGPIWGFFNYRERAGLRPFLRRLGSVEAAAGL